MSEALKHGIAEYEATRSIEKSNSDGKNACEQLLALLGNAGNNQAKLRVVIGAAARIFPQPVFCEPIGYWHFGNN